MSETAQTLDFDSYYMVDGYRGIAFYLVGFATEADGGEEDEGWVRAVMVGDDRTHLVEVDSLTRIDREEFCGQCGQVGCGHDGLDR